MFYVYFKLPRLFLVVTFSLYDSIVHILGVPLIANKVYQLGLFQPNNRLKMATRNDL